MLNPICENQNLAMRCFLQDIFQNLCQPFGSVFTCSQFVDHQSGKHNALLIVDDSIELGIIVGIFIDFDVNSGICNIASVRIVEQRT